MVIFEPDRYMLPELSFFSHSFKSLVRYAFTSYFKPPKLAQLSLTSYEAVIVFCTRVEVCFRRDFLIQRSMELISSTWLLG